MKHHCKPSYSGHWPHHAHECHPPAAHQQHGFCHSCCQPASTCCCRHKECRKESKELLVLSDKSIMPSGGGLAVITLLNLLVLVKTDQDFPQVVKSVANGEEKLPFQLGYNQTFIGGGCCIHMSVEYMPIARDIPFSGVAVLAKDSKGTVLLWEKSIDETHTGYQIQEDIITTHPGAELALVTINAVARVRWCEVFSETCC